jgi:hypothetical protein
MAIDKEEFKDYLQFTGNWQGGRCKDAVSTADGDIIACAITISTLDYLLSSARAKRLSKHDIQIVIDAFMQKAGMVEETTPMGGNYFRRVTTTTETKDAT